MNGVQMFIFCIFIYTSTIFIIVIWEIFDFYVDHWQNQTDQIFNAIPFQIKITRFVTSDNDHNMQVFFDMDWHEYLCLQKGHQIITFA